jgi:hypothetical protein
MVLYVHARAKHISKQEDAYGKQKYDQNIRAEKSLAKPPETPGGSGTGA